MQLIYFSCLTTVATTTKRMLNKIIKASFLVVFSIFPYVYLQCFTIIVMLATRLKYSLCCKNIFLPKLKQQHNNKSSQVMEVLVCPFFLKKGQYAEFYFRYSQDCCFRRKINLNKPSTESVTFKSSIHRKKF